MHLVDWLISKCLAHFRLLFYTKLLAVSKVRTWNWSELSMTITKSYYFEVINMFYMYFKHFWDTDQTVPCASSESFSLPHCPAAVYKVVGYWWWQQYGGRSCQHCLEYSLHQGCSSTLASTLPHLKKPKYMQLAGMSDCI